MAPSKDLATPEAQGSLLASQAPAGKKKRIESLDAFRGFTILAMLFVIQVAGYTHLPLTFPQFGSAPVSTFKHAGEDNEPEEWAFSEKKSASQAYHQAKVTQVEANGRYGVALLDEKGAPTGAAFHDVRVNAAKPLRAGENVIAIGNKDAGYRFQGTGNGCTFTDLVAPFFVFIVGVCIPLSRGRRGMDWWRHVGSRTLMLIAAGVVYISLIFGISWWWGILQAIGIAYFMGAAFMLLPVWGRWVAVALVAAFHGYMSWHFPWWLELGNKAQPFMALGNPDMLARKVVSYSGDPLKPLTVHCTPWASISYGLITVIGTLLGEAVVTRSHKTVLRQALLIGVGCSVAGYLLHLFQAPMNKDFVSPSYSIFTAGIGALSFLVFYWVMDVWQIRKWAWLLTVIGSNALLAYFLQPIVRLFLTSLGLHAYLRGLSGWNAMLGGVAWTALLWAIVYACNRKGVYWKL